MNNTKAIAIQCLIRDSAVKRRGEGVAARRDRHRDGEHVVGEQRNAGHLRGKQTEVVAGDDVGAAGGGVGLDGLAVRQDQEAEHHEQCERHRCDE